MVFSPGFYYFAMLENTFFRMWWLCVSVRIYYSDRTLYLEDMQLLSFVNMIFSILRRTIWAMLRTENEFFNNYESFRDILLIPPIKDEEEGEDYDGSLN